MTCEVKSKLLISGSNWWFAFNLKNLDYDYEKKKNQINVVKQKNNFIYGLFEMLELNDSYFVTSLI